MNREEAIRRATVFRVGHVTLARDGGEKVHVTKQPAHRMPRLSGAVGQPSVSEAKRYVRMLGQRCVAQRPGENLRREMLRRWVADEARAVAMTNVANLEQQLADIASRFASDGTTDTDQRNALEVARSVLEKELKEQQEVVRKNTI